MDRFIGRRSLYNAITFLMLALTGTFVFRFAIRSAEDARLLTIEEQQFIVCGTSPGRCDYPPAGSQCSKSDVQCAGQNSYCQRVQKEGMTCEKEYLYQNPLRCLAGGTGRTGCVESNPPPVTCYYYFSCQCYYDTSNKVWACGDVYGAGENDIGECSNFTIGG